MLVSRYFAVPYASEPRLQDLELLLLLEAFRIVLELNSLPDLSLSYEYYSPPSSIQPHGLSVDGLAVLALRHGVLSGLEEGNIYRNNSS